MCGTFEVQEVGKGGVDQPQTKSASNQKIIH